MKRLLVGIAVFIVLYSSYYDLTTGTLPGTPNKSNVEAEAPEPVTDSEDRDTPYPSLAIPSQEVIVEPGYTVLSIVEHLHEGPIAPSIQEIIYDFKELNPGINPDEIQVGETYLFPIYQP
ncbi:hypothetical protein [Desertibacillus haloalkaliphilus]|uniref:hypothetical protein n=1 Tax=Desertibacillus haloalkaliphilus TaxID=1328930 RepID=UPI001C2640E0|nr:hypothetical protein [Desertibacillus haloalkaliphilus]MBU8905705.1 hypothetical protein [Desertibacillus haloalkaliphilus]